MSFALRLLASLSIAVASLGCDDYKVCAPPLAARQSELPQRLADFVPLNAGTPEAEGVHAYEPRAVLYADGATKRRWVRLPAGAKIDSSDPDVWRFPVGTSFWKEFSIDGAPVETRLLLKTGARDDEWAAMAYVWRDGQAIAAPDGAELPGHTVPSSAQCFGCHGGRPSRVLGFSAVQLPARGEEGSWGVEELVKDDRLSAPPTHAFELQGSDAARAALEYLHANCSHCHNNERPEGEGPRCYDPQHSFSFLLHAGDRAVEATDTYQTAVGDKIRGGDPEGSSAMKHFLRESDPPMPPLGTSSVDRDGEALLRAWILALPEE